MQEQRDSNAAYCLPLKICRTQKATCTHTEDNGEEDSRTSPSPAAGSLISDSCTSSPAAGSPTCAATQGSLACKGEEGAHPTQWGQREAGQEASPEQYQQGVGEQGFSGPIQLLPSYLSTLPAGQVWGVPAYVPFYPLPQPHQALPYPACYEQALKPASEDAEGGHYEQSLHAQAHIQAVEDSGGQAGSCTAGGRQGGQHPDSTHPAPISTLASTEVQRQAMCEGVLKWPSPCPGEGGAKGQARGKRGKGEPKGAHHSQRDQQQQQQDQPHPSLSQQQQQHPSPTPNHPQLQCTDLPSHPPPTPQLPSIQVHQHPPLQPQLPLPPKPSRIRFTSSRVSTGPSTLSPTPSLGAPMPTATTNSRVRPMLPQGQFVTSSSSNLVALARPPLPPSSRCTLSPGANIQTFGSPASAAVCPVANPSSMPQHPQLLQQHQRVHQLALHRRHSSSLCHSSGSMASWPSQTFIASVCPSTTQPLPSWLPLYCSTPSMPPSPACSFSSSSSISSLPAEYHQLPAGPPQTAALAYPSSLPPRLHFCPPLMGNPAFSQQQLQQQPKQQQ